MIYYIYHIPGKKIGVTHDLNKRVTEQQGYEEHEYEILGRYTSIDRVSERELFYQRIYGYRVDEVPYNKLNFNKKENEMNVNVTEQTTTFPCPVNKLKGQLMDNIGMTWETVHGHCILTAESIKWIMQNISKSKYNDQRSYIYNKAFDRYFDNNDAHANKEEEVIHRTLTGGLAPTGMKEYVNAQDRDIPECCDENSPCECKEDELTQFELIRGWAEERGLYDSGDAKTQALKLVEEVGETCRAILKDDRDGAIDGIGDCVVVLTNLAEFLDVDIEECIEIAYDEISQRTGKMVNGTFVKD
jgi:NTP pyrophosphatase (non-canonical NTP hydrolase)|tara:strand:- start:249 stop:1151 length:903 start_codon:yes stop_codon:yes gene_type:complete